MRTRWILMLFLALGLGQSVLPTATAAEQIQTAAAPQAGVRDGDASPSYAVREVSAADLETFEGGRQVIIATEYDVHILVSIVVIAAVVLVILLI
jgi:hypothetical protein